MTTVLKRAEGIANSGTPASQVVQLFDKPVDYPNAEQRGPLDRRLRNLILLANVVVWVFIILIVRLALF